MVATSSTPTPRPATDYSKRHFKARIYWTWVKPGTSGQFDMYSFDTSGRYKVTDPREYGMRMLRNEIDKLGPKVARAIIYDQQAPNKPEVVRKENGIWKD